MRPSAAAAPAALALVLAALHADQPSCACDAFVVASPKAPVGKRGGTTARSTPRHRYHHRRQENRNNEHPVQLHASSPPGRYDHLHANARPGANPNNHHLHQTFQQSEAARAVSDQFIEAYLHSLPSLRRHSGDAVIQRSIEAVRRAIASYLMDAGKNDIDWNNDATKALPEGGNAASLPYSNDDPDPRQAWQQQQPQQQQPPSLAAEATSKARAAVHQAEAALTDYLDGLSSGQFVSTPGSAEAVGAIRSYLDSLAAVETQAASSASSRSSGGSSGVGKSYGQSPYLQHIDEACDADDVAAGNTITQECTRAIGGYLDALEAEATTSSAAGASRILGYLDSIAAAPSSYRPSDVAAAPGSAASPAGGGGYLEALSGGDGPPSLPSWASTGTDTSTDTSPSSYSRAGAAPAPHSEDETTINVASTTDIQNVNALADINISGEDGVIARSVHEEDGGDTTTETTVTKEGDDTVLTITSTTRIVLPKE